MATLHVRNVPDSLYETLRSQAEANGRSIGAEAVQLLERALAFGAARRRGHWPRGRRRSGFAPFRRFTGRARAAVAAAQDAARALGHDHVGTGHLLLGLLAVEDGVAAVALARLGLSAEQARAEVERLAPASGEAPPGRIPFAPGAKKALELALREALALGRDAIGTEHLLLGLVAEEEGAGAQIVRAVEPDVDRVRAALAEAVTAARVEFRPEPPPEPAEFLVVELEASARDWQDALNDAAGRGFELVEIVDRRAIFRRD